MDFGYGLKKSGSVEQTTAKSVELIPGLSIYKRNAFGTFLEVDAGECDLKFKSSTLGSEGKTLYDQKNMLGLTRKTFNNHFTGQKTCDIALLVNHIMIQKENNEYRDIIVNELRRLGELYNCAVPSGETAVMNTLKGIYLGLSSISIDKQGTSIDLTGKVLIPHADGVGTKSLVYLEGDYGFVQDGVAMNLNDILVAGKKCPEKTFGSNILIIGQGYENHVKGIKKELETVWKEHNITPMVNDHVLMENFKGVELDMVLTSIYDKKDLKSVPLEKDDLIIGLASSGIHSNGLTGARSYAETLSEENRKKFYKKLAVPTIIYDKVFEAIKDLEIKEAVNITGGGFTKVLKVMPEGLCARMHTIHSLEPHDFFSNIYRKLKRSDGAVAANKRMYSCFNCGIGLMLVIKNEELEAFLDRINEAGYKADVIGYIDKGKRSLEVRSKFNYEFVCYD